MWHVIRVCVYLLWIFAVELSRSSNFKNFQNHYESGIRQAIFRYVCTYSFIHSFIHTFDNDGVGARGGDGGGGCCSHEKSKVEIIKFERTTTVSTYNTI